MEAGVDGIPCQAWKKGILCTHTQKKNSIWTSVLQQWAAISFFVLLCIVEKHILGCRVRSIKPARCECGVKLGESIRGSLSQSIYLFIYLIWSTPPSSQQEAIMKGGKNRNKNGENWGIGGKILQYYIYVQVWKKIVSMCKLFLFEKVWNVPGRR